jgi:outer membrane protein TolC
MSRKCISWLWALLLGSSAYAGGNLAQAWQHLLDTNPALKASQAKQQSRMASIDAVKATRLPRLDATATYQVTSETSRIQLQMPALVPGATPITLDKSLGDHDRAELGLTASYAIFTGFAQTNQIQSQTLILQATGMEQEQLRNNLGLQFGLLHFSIQVAQEESRLRLSRLEARRSHVNTLEVQAKAGVATLAQVLSAKADFARSVADTSATRRTLDSLTAEFEGLTGVPYPDVYTHKFNLPDNQTPTKSLQAEGIETQALAVDKAGEAATSTRYPWVSTFAGYRYGNPGLNQTANEWMGYALLGVQVQWNLFDGRERKASMARTQADSRTLRAEAERLRSVQTTALTTLSAERRASTAEGDALASGLEAARSAQDAYGAALKNGSATADDMLDAQIRVVELESRLAQWNIRNAILDLRTRWQSGQTITFSETQP